MAMQGIDVSNWQKGINLDVLPIDFEVSEFRAEFRLAAKMGDTMYIRTTSENGKFYVVFTDKEENPYFLSEFTPTKNGE